MRNFEKGDYNMSVYVITHKAFNFDLPNGYKVMLVGANKNKNPQNYLTDNTMDNISDKNSSYCELTGLYWLWKNSNDKNIGLVHYRRFFYKKSIGGRNSMYLRLLLLGPVKPATKKQLDTLLNQYDWVVAHPEHEGNKNLWNQFVVFNHEKDLINTRNAIRKLYPEYLNDFDEVMHSSDMMSPYNMFYTTKRNMDEYCEWLFSILSFVESKTDMTGYTDYQKRLYGFLSERLLNVYLKHNKKFKIKYLTVFKTDDLDRKRVFKRLTNKLGITK